MEMVDDMAINKNIGMVNYHIELCATMAIKLVIQNGTSLTKLYAI